MTPTRVLIIAGSDSSAGAGIQADLKTAQAFGCYAQTAITAVTAQNTRGVRAVHLVPPEIVAAQIEACLSDIGADAIKIGMLGSAKVVKAVAAVLAKRARKIPIVLDPVMVSTSGHSLLAANAVAAMTKELFPLAALVTPNIPEAKALAHLKGTKRNDAEAAARKLIAMGGGGRAHQRRPRNALDHRRCDGVERRRRDLRLPAHQDEAHARHGLHALNRYCVRIGARVVTSASRRPRARICAEGHRDRAGSRQRARTAQSRNEVNGTAVPYFQFAARRSASEVVIIRLTKIEAARRQIEAAIRALFEDDDSIATHTLAAAGSQIVRDLCEVANVVGFEEFKDWIKPEYLKDFWGKFNESSSFLKHADRDGSATYDFKPEETEYILLFAVKWYRDLGNPTTPTMLLFLTWFGACHPNIIAKGANDLMAQALRQAAQHAQYLDRDQRLKVGADLLAKMNQAD